MKGCVPRLIPSKSLLQVRADTYLAFGGGQKFRNFWSKFWPTQSARGKNFGGVFFDVFRESDQESAIKLPNYSLLPDIFDF